MFTMMTAEFILRGSIFTLLLVVTCGFPFKGSQTTSQSSGGANAGANYASYQGGPPRLSAAPYSTVGAAYGSTSVTGPSPYQPVVVAPGFSSFDSSAPVVVQAAGVSPVGVQAAGMSPVGVQAAGVDQAGGLLSSLPGVAYVTSPVMYMPATEYNAGTQDEPVTEWIIPTTIFEAGSADTPAIGDILPPAPPAPQEPTLRSGETASVSKEAEQGVYQQLLEEFGYPADFQGSGPEFGQGLTTVLMPGAQLGGFRPVSAAGKFDHMLMYGLYPPGSHSTFSQNHEAGKDYSQAIHYLTEHVSQSHGQQKKFFPGAR